MKNRILISFLLLALAFLTSCERASKSYQTKDEINVAAAANLTNVFKEIGDEFTKRNGVRVVYSFGATADLSRQIEQGAPFDAFAAADTEHVEVLERKGLLTPDTRRVYARGELVLWTPPNGKVKIENLKDLARDDVAKSVQRIAIANPEVAPYGRAAVETLRALNVWKDYESKIVYSANVAQARQFAATGNADVAFIPRSLVKEGEGNFIAVDENFHQPIDQAIAVVKASKKQEAARRFVDFVTSPDGRAILARYGYR